MFLQKEEKQKHNDAAKLFIAKMAMLAMIKIREKDVNKTSMLPIPKGLDEINEQNTLLFSVINNIIKNELKLEDIGEKEIRFAESSYLNDVDTLKVINSSIDNSEVSNMLADRLLYDIDFVRNTVIEAIKKLTKNVLTAKAQYETGRGANTFSLIPVGIPSIIQYFINRGDFKDLESNPVNIPIATGNQDQYLNFDEVTELDLKNQLLSHFEFNKQEVYDLLANYQEGEIISIVRNYLTVLNDRNENLKFLSAMSTFNYDKLYLIYLVSTMLIETTYPDSNALKIINNGLKVLIAGATKLIQNYLNKNIVTTYVDKDKIYVLEDVFANNEIDTTVIVGGVLNANIKNNTGAILLSLEDLNLNAETFKEKFNSARIAKEVEIETGMKQAMINIYAIEAKNLIEELKEDENIEVSKLAILAVVQNYISELDFKTTVDVENVCTAIVLNHIYKSEVAAKFIEYFNTYSIMNSNLTSQDCALLAGASIMVIELGSNIVLE